MPERSNSGDFPDGGGREGTSVAVRAFFGVIFAVGLLLGGLATYLFVTDARLSRSNVALVRDEAQILSPDQRDRLTEFHRFLLADHGIDYRVVTSAGTGDLDRFAVKTYEAMEIGRRNNGFRGMLLVIDPESDRVRLEVGRTLEGNFPDGFVAYVEQRQMVPFFEQARVAEGILATTELIIARVLDEKRKGGFQDGIALDGSAGGGASTDARIGDGLPPEETGSGGSVSETDASIAVSELADSLTATPRATVAAYLNVMEMRVSDPALPIYSGETKAMLSDWTVTPAQMDSVARTYRRCSIDRVFKEGNRAVVRYRLSERACAPFFLRREDDAWRLDLTMMQSAVRFGRNNAWRFDPDVGHPYEFAFTDWRFDRNGFPVR